MNFVWPISRPFLSSISLDELVEQLHVRSTVDFRECNAVHVTADSVLEIAHRQ